MRNAMLQILLFILAALPLIISRITTEDLSIAEGIITILILGYFAMKNKEYLDFINYLQYQLQQREENANTKEKV